MNLEDKVKLDLIDRAMQGTTWRQIAKDTGIPRSTVSDFLAKRTYQKWWDEHSDAYQPAMLQGARILIYDIENSPEVAYTWGRWKENIPEDRIIQRPIMLTWAAMWLGETEIISDKLSNYFGDDHVVTPHPQNLNDKPLVESLWAMFDEADIIVAHNNDRHDESFFKTRCLVHGILPPSPYKRIDTLKEIKRVFKFPSNALKSLMNQLDLSRKLEHDGFILWADCLRGVKEAYVKMEEYNLGDITALRDLYLTIRPWIINHPNVSLYGDNDKPACIACGSTELQFLPDKFSYTGVSVFNVYRCECCGKNNRSRNSVKTPAQRKTVLTNAL